VRHEADTASELPFFWSAFEGRLEHRGSKASASEVTQPWRILNISQS
jgi:hypothetical protein